MSDIVGEIYGGIANLYGRYAHAMDSGDVDGFAECFTEHCSFWPNRGPFQPDTGNFSGRSAVREFLERSHKGRPNHTFYNLVILDASRDRATTSSKFSLLNMSSGEIMGYGTYNDEVVKGDDATWRFEVKGVSFLWQSEAYLERIKKLPKRT